MNTFSHRTQVMSLVKVREYYEEKVGLFGLLKYKVVIKQETIGNALWIESEREPDEIYFNGKKLNI